jgi:hypothetical protein
MENIIRRIKNNATLRRALVDTVAGQRKCQLTPQDSTERAPKFLYSIINK